MSTTPAPASPTVIKAAYAAYDAEDREWFYNQSTETLEALWVICCRVNDGLLGAAWDDEVYDALAERGYFKD
jgi:hypothetical protein